jgi:hypothetical protein
MRTMSRRPASEASLPSGDAEPPQRLQSDTGARCVSLAAVVGGMLLHTYGRRPEHPS